MKKNRAAARIGGACCLDRGPLQETTCKWRQERSERVSFADLLGWYALINECKARSYGELSESRSCEKSGVVEAENGVGDC